MRSLALAAVVAIGAVSAPVSAELIHLGYTQPVDRAVDLEAGTWQITPFDGGTTNDLQDFRAYTVWNNVTGCDGEGLNCTQGWIWSYELVDAGDNPISSASFGRVATPGLAFAAAQAAGPFSFVLDSPQTLRFVFTDSNYSDNRGGVSFDLSLVQRPPSNDVPTPGTAMLLGLGLAALAGSAARRRTRERA